MTSARRKAHVRVRDLTKAFALAEKGAGPVSLVDALRTGRRETVHREVRALKGVSFDIAEGERVGIIGHNGAGKTTLLSLLACITDPTSGTVDIAGDVHAMLTIGAVLRDEATGRENIRLDGAVHGKSREEIAAHMEEIVAFADLGEFIDRPVRTYSSGMKARLAFSMGAFIEPDVLIIDETLSVGDPFFAAKAMARMKQVAAQGRIVIMVSHALASIVDLCNRCLWLDDGRLVMDGDPVAVTRAYQEAVAKADEAGLAAKFHARVAFVRRPEAGRLMGFSLMQSAAELSTTARAFMPLTLIVTGAVGAAMRAPDLVLVITRVDGRHILKRRLSETEERLPQTGPFTLTIDFDPLILGASLYRFDVTLLAGEEPVDGAHRVVDIIDEEAQFGGQPLLYHPPLIAARRLGDPQS